MVDKSTSLGETIRTLRIEKGISLHDIAALTGISEDDFSRIESDELSPPLGTIISIAKVLEVRVGDFFGDTGNSPFCIVRKDNGAAVSRFSADYSKSCGYSYQGLGQQKRNRQMEPFLITLNPTNEHTQALANQHIGEEFIFVLEGDVEVKILDHKDVLHTGDSIYYDSNVPHIISCHGDKPATILAVIYAKEEMIIL